MCSNAESHQSLSVANEPLPFESTTTTTAKTTSVVAAEHSGQQSFSEANSHHGPLLNAGSSSRRNTVTYDISSGQKNGNILLTDLVQQLIPPEPKTGKMNFD